MLRLWNLFLSISLPVSLHVIAISKDSVEEKQRLNPDRGVSHESPIFGTENLLGLALSWPLSSSEQSDRQGVIGEYADLPESTEASLLYQDDKGLIISRLTDSDSEEDMFKESAQSQSAQEQPTLIYHPAQSENGSILQATQTSRNQAVFPKSDQLPLPWPGSIPSTQDPFTPVFAQPGPSPEHPSPTVASGSWRGTTGPSDITQGQRIGVKDTDNSKDDDLLVSNTISLDGDMHTSGTPCKTSNQSWTHTYPDDFVPNEYPHQSLALRAAFFVPLYSDWNSALATWGFAWEVHIYGLGSVFTIFGLISVVCLLGLPLRCPPGVPYLTLLHLFLLAFAEIQAFSLLYDAYSHQDRLPPVGSLLLLELPSPCLISSFSLAILLLSLRSRIHLSLPLANSTSFLVLLKPCLLLCMSLLHFAVSLVCVGMLQLFQSLPIMILLFPQGMFVCLTVFLSCSYLIFYCLIKVNTKHIYRLNDSGESGGSPEIMRPGSCPFAKMEDWDRAAGAGVGASLCLLGCGGLQVYGILHALGLGGFNGYGFRPWPWWGYQVSCRLCEIGVCLGLSLIGTHPLCCNNSASIKTITHPQPGSWSRLSCSSPSRGLTLPSQGGSNSPVLSSHESWSQNKQEKLVICDVIAKEQSEGFPLFQMVDSPGNGLDCVPKTNQTQNTTVPLPTPSSPSHKPKNTVESQLSSLDSLQLDTDSTIDLRPPSPINLSRSIDQALFSESLFSPSIFGMSRIFHTSSSQSLSSPSQDISKQGSSSIENTLYRTSSCGDVDQENALSSSRLSQPHVPLTSQIQAQVSPGEWDLKGSVCGSTQGLCSNPKETRKLRSHSWANRGQNFAQSSIPRAIPHLSYHRRYRTLSLASQDSQGSGRLAGAKHLSDSKQLEWDLAVQAEFVNVCKQIDALSVCSDTIEL